MPWTKYQQAKIEKDAKIALAFHKQGFSVRKIQNMMAAMGVKRHYVTIARWVKKLSTEDKG